METQLIFDFGIDRLTRQAIENGVTMWDAETGEIFAVQARSIGRSSPEYSCSCSRPCKAFMNGKGNAPHCIWERARMCITRAKRILDN